MCFLYYLFLIFPLWEDPKGGEKYAGCIHSMRPARDDIRNDPRQDARRAIGQRLEIQKMKPGGLPKK
jgi:hypothetical protein